MFNLDFLVDESSFGMSQAIQKCMKLTKHPNFRKKIREPGVEDPKWWLNFFMCVVLSD